jgi:thioredoxin 1
MKDVQLFIQKSCPFCKQALSWMNELKSENPDYSEVAVTIIDENEQPELANQYDYYYVPTYYVSGTKVHEGAASKSIVKEVFEKASK